MRNVKRTKLGRQIAGVYIIEGNQDVSPHRSAGGSGRKSGSILGGGAMVQGVRDAVQLINASHEQNLNVMSSTTVSHR